MKSSQFNLFLTILQHSRSSYVWHCHPDDGIIYGVSSSKQIRNPIQVSQSYGLDMSEDPLFHVITRAIGNREGQTPFSIQHRDKILEALGI